MVGHETESSTLGYDPYFIMLYCGICIGKILLQHHLAAPANNTDFTPILNSTWYLVTAIMMSKINYLQVLIYLEIPGLIKLLLPADVAPVRGMIWQNMTVVSIRCMTSLSVWHNVMYDISSCQRNRDVRRI